MSDLAPLPDLLLRPHVEAALREDLGRAGDITSTAIISDTILWRAKLNARQPGVIAGLDLARLAFTSFDPTVVFQPRIVDGSFVTPGTCLAEIEGRARSLLAAERVALNFLSHLSGIATQTDLLVKAVRPHKAHVCCTRKTTPGLRALEKYAVRAGGGHNHRFGLDDALLIKDNHIAVAGGVQAAVEQARRHVGHLIKVELEVDTLSQLDEALSLLPMIDIIMLDNMTPALLKEAVLRTAGRVKLEASGNVRLETIQDIAASGVDLISCGWITHSAPILDIGLDNA